MNKSVKGGPPLSGAPEGRPRGGAAELGSPAETGVGRPWGEDTGAGDVHLGQEWGGGVGCPALPEPGQRINLQVRLLRNASRTWVETWVSLVSCLTGPVLGSELSGVLVPPSV